MAHSLMTRLALLFALIALFCNFSEAQIVIPGGGVSSMGDVPGLTNDLANCITNVDNGGPTGTQQGEVNKITGRNWQIKFPSVQPLTTNGMQGQFTIDPSGTTRFTFPAAFTSPPYVSFTMADTNLNQVVTPNILNVTRTNCTVQFISAGAPVTNEWTVYYYAILGYSYGVYGTAPLTIAGLSDGTNVYRRDGTFGMTAPFYMPYGAAADSWLAGDGTGHGTWQTRSAGNLVDGGDLLRRNGSVAWTGNQDANYNSLQNLMSVHIPGGAGVGRVLGSDAAGNGTWHDWGAQYWGNYPAVTHINAAGWNITSVGTITVTVGSFGTVNASTIIVGNETVNGLLTCKAGVLINTAGSFTSERAMYANNGLYLDYAGIFNCNRQAYFYKPTVFTDVITGTFTPNGYVNIIGNAAAEGKKLGVAGINSWVQIDCFRAGNPVLYIPNGYTQTKGLWSTDDVTVQGDFVATGSKSFRITHPLDTNKYLYHGSIEAPRNDLIYRGTATLVNGTATVSIDTESRMTPGTFAVLTKNSVGQAWNNASFTRVRVSSIAAGQLTIVAETNTCADIVNWVVYAERNDSGVTNSPTCDPQGNYQPEVNK